MPETRAERIARLESTPDRTRRQDLMLAAEKAVIAAAARTDALDRQYRTRN